MKNNKGKPPPGKQKLVGVKKKTVECDTYKENAG